MTLKSAIESILFISGEPFEVSRLAKIMKNKPEAVREALTALEEEYAVRGIRLSNLHDRWQFTTAPENAGVIEDLVKSEFSEELSKAALETLSVIAYKGPLTRAEIEYVRGVNSSFTIRNLMLRGLVERIDNPNDARSYLYRITLDFLHHLGLSKIEELPEWEEFRKTSITLPDSQQNHEAE